MPDKYLCIDSNNILKSIKPNIYHYEFDASTEMISVDTSHKLVHFPLGGYYDELGSVFTLRSNHTAVSLSGKYELRNRILINGIYYYFKASCPVTDKFLFTCIITNTVSDYEYHVESTGEYILVPITATVEGYINFINESSSSLYLELSDSFTPLISNIFGVNLFDSRLEYSIHEVYPYESAQEFHLDEPMQVSTLINDLRREYPSIQFYTDPNDRCNFKNTNEAIYYEASIFDDDNRTAGVLHYNDPVYGRVVQEEIPIIFRYETPDIFQYINRRNEYLLNKFLSPIDLIHPKVSGDPVHIGVHWERYLNEQPPAKVNDQSDRVVYSFQTKCIIIALLLEKSQDPITIGDVIMFIYSDGMKPVDIHKITDKITGQEVIEYESPPKVK